MCEFKSGIILKNRVYIADIDSHSDMLEQLGTKDDYFGATEKFVRAELIPLNGEWWTDPDGWRANVDQDVLPEWFELDREKYLSDFKASVRSWWLEHVLVDQKIEELTAGYYRLKRCEVKKLLNDVKVWCDSSSVQEMHDSSSVQRMCGISSVQEMYDSSSVQRMCGISSVQRMCDSSSVQEMCDSSSVQRMYGSSSVQEMRGSSSVQRMYDSSSVQRMYDSSIARNYSKGKIFISPETTLKIETFENPKEDK